MLTKRKFKFKVDAGKLIAASLGITIAATSYSHAGAPLTDGNTVVAKVSLESGRAAPATVEETHSVNFEDGSSFDLSFIDRAYQSSTKPELVSISVDGNLLGQTTPGYDSAVSVFSETTLKTINRISCKTDKQLECTAVRVSFTAVQTAKKQANVSEDDDLNCLLEVEREPISVSAYCRDIS